MGMNRRREKGWRERKNELMLRRKRRERTERKVEEMEEGDGWRGK